MSRPRRPTMPSLGSNGDSYRSSIRLRRMPSEASFAREEPSAGTTSTDETVTRRRSLSAPQRPRVQSISRPEVGRQPTHMTPIEEGQTPVRLQPPEDAYMRPDSTIIRDYAPVVDTNKPLPVPPSTRSRRTSLRRSRPTSSATDAQEYDSNLVDLLDLVDPEVSTLNSLNNVQNSLFVPNLGGWLNRRPTYDLSPHDYESQPGRKRGNSRAEEPPKSPVVEAVLAPDTSSLARSNTISSITSRQTVSHYAVLPHGISLSGWSEAEKQELDDHVRHFLHSRRSKFKRSMKGFSKYVRKPLGFFVTLYATLITLFGLAWVLFLIGWINVGGRQLYIINVIDNVLVALFAVMGDGLAPFRAVDTYHMIYIAHYHHYTWSVRKKRKLPDLKNHNDLPRLSTSVERSELDDVDIEGDASMKKDDEFDEAEESVLTPQQQKKLEHHQKKFSRSHTFYKPHETATHHAFPLRMLVAIVVLLDCHSCLQLSLGLCTWIISYHVRPFALTTVILCVSITVNITAGILISVGDHKTRKKDVLEKMHRQELTQEAIDKLERRRDRERQRNIELDALQVPPALTHSVNGQTTGTHGIVKDYDNSASKAAVGLI